MQPSRRNLGQLGRALLLALVCSAFVSGLMLVLPAFALRMVETVLPSGSFDLLTMLVGVAAGALLIAGLLDACRELVLLRAGLWLDHTMGAAMLEAGIVCGDGPITIRQRADATTTLRKALSDGALVPLLDLPWVMLACAGLALLDPLLGLASACCLGVMLCCLLMQQLATRTSHRRAREVEAAATRNASQWAEHADLVATQGLVCGAVRSWELTNRWHVVQAYLNGRRAGISRAAARGLEHFCLVGMIAFSAHSTVIGAVAPGLAVAAVLLVTRGLGLVERTNANLAILMDCHNAWRLLRDAERGNVTAGLPAVSIGRIEITDATFSYPGSRRPALCNVNLAIAPGECIGLIGPHGSGKTSLAAMIAGATAPQAGRADLDGAPLVAHQRGVGNRPIGYVADEPRLVEGSIADNIGGFAAHSEANVATAAIRAGVHASLSTLPEGYATNVGPDGRALPMRARRAIALARALYESPGTLVLDEPELGLDATALAQLVTALDKLRADGVGLVLATNEPRLLRLTDRIVVLSSGAVEAVLPSYQVTGMAPEIRRVA